MDKINVAGGNDVISVGDGFFVAETMTWRFNRSTRVSLRLDHMSTYDWTINEMVKTNVVRDDDVVLRQKATCKHLIGTRRDRRGKTPHLHDVITTRDVM